MLDSHAEWELTVVLFGSSRSFLLAARLSLPLELQLAILKIAANGEDQTAEDRPRSNRSRNTLLKFCRVSRAWAVSWTYSASRWTWQKSVD